MFRFITQDAHKMEVAPRPPPTVTNAVSWRAEGIKYRKNELFIYIVENCKPLGARARELLWRWRAEYRRGAARRGGPGMSLPLRERPGGTGCAAVRGGTSAPRAQGPRLCLQVSLPGTYLLPADAGAERELCVLLRPGGRGEGERAVRLRRPGRGRGGRRLLASARAGRSATDVAVPPIRDTQLHKQRRGLHRHQPAARRLRRADLDPHRALLN